MPHCVNQRFVVGTMLLFLLSSCSAEATEDANEKPPVPTGLYAASCDQDDGTIAFQSAGVAVVKFGDCHAYRVETWNYRLDDDTVILAPEGLLDDPDVPQVMFHIVSASEIERVSTWGFGVCSNCETYVKQ